MNTNPDPLCELKGLLTRCLRQENRKFFPAVARDNGALTAFLKDCGKTAEHKVPAAMSEAVITFFEEIDIAKQERKWSLCQKGPSMFLLKPVIKISPDVKTRKGITNRQLFGLFIKQGVRNSRRRQCGHGIEKAQVIVCKSLRFFGIDPKRSDDPALVKQYRKAYDRLRAAALPLEASLALIEQAAEDGRNGNQRD